MGKRHPNLPAWQWRVAPQASGDSTLQGLQLLALLLFALSFLLMASGVFRQDLTNFAIGVIGALAAFGMKRRASSFKLQV